LIAVTKDVASPRLPTLGDKLKARKAEIETWGIEELSVVCGKDKFGIKGSHARIHKITIPTDEGRKGEIFRGSVDEAVEKIVDNLEEEGMLGGVK
ncbi:MAG: electron transfer flavoprotein, beta subunit, partial [Dehalococcoidia bacterium]|nr:electron transfer flavoprotein, beta subunit [Dehalococcoidia bacterium]